MNRFSVLAMLLLLAAQNASSQTWVDPLPEFDTRHLGDPLRLIDEKYAEANKKAGDISRLAYKVATGNDMNYDTIYYQYDGSSGWDAKSDSWKFAARRANFMGTLKREYDSRGNIVAENVYRPDQKGGLQPRSRELLTYANDKVVSESSQQWSEAGWMNESKEEHTYDEKGNKTMSLKYKWNSASAQWEIKSRWTYTYTKGNDVSLMKIDAWRTNENRWLPVAEIGYKYKDGKLIEESDKTRDGNKWEVLYKQKHRYDERGRAIEADCLNFLDRKNWNILRHQFHYDKNNNIDSVLVTRIEDEISRTIERISITYNEYGQPLVENCERWDSVTQIWFHATGARHTSFHYDRAK